MSVTWEPLLFDAKIYTASKKIWGAGARRGSGRARLLRGQVAVQASAAVIARALAD